MLMNYALLAIGTLIVIALFAIFVKMVTGKQPLSTPDTMSNVKAMVEKQTELNASIGMEVRNAGWWQTRKLKKEMGHELYHFYFKHP